MFSSFAEVAMSCVTETRDVSSASNFALEDRSPVKSFMYIKNNNSPKMEHLGAPAVTFHHPDVWPFRRILCFLSLKKLDQRSTRLPDIPFCDNLKRRPLCHTLSKALEMSLKTLLTSSPSSNELKSSTLELRLFYKNMVIFKQKVKQLIGNLSFKDFRTYWE